VTSPRLTWTRRAALGIAAAVALVSLPTVPAHALDEISPAPAPVLTGDAEPGGNLVIDTTGWADDVTFSYEWFIDGVQDPATGFNFGVRDEDAGKVFVAAVIGHRDGYLDTRRETAPVTIASFPLTLTPTPTISGTPTYGQTLAAVPGTWDDGVKLSYQWWRSGTPIAGATAASYTAAVADLGAPLSVRVTGTKPGHTTVTTTSGPTAPIAAATLAAGTVRINGTAKVGRTLAARPSGFDTGAGVAYRWLVGTKVVGSGTELKLTKKLAGKKVVLQAVVTKAGYETVTVASTPVKVKKIKKPGKKGRGRG